MIFPCNSTLPLKQKLKHSEPSLYETGEGLGGARTELHARAPPLGAFKGSPTRLQLGKLGSQWEERWAPRVSGQSGRGVSQDPTPGIAVGGITGKTNLIKSGANLKG